MAKYDWTKIKAEYVEVVSESERPTLDALAKKYGCNPDYLRAKASKDNWLEDSNKFLTLTSQKRRVKKSDLMAEAQSQFDTECLRLAKAGLSYVAREMEDLQNNPDNRRFISVMKVLEMSQKVGKTAIGDINWAVGQILNWGYIVSAPTEEQTEEYFGFTDVIDPEPREPNYLK
ncbi:hypothetical protein Syn7502_01484 [Synechococcus sp. PCC 7502]|uniref:hypothetical protein n=1 Tax=Synechococcus sp. PCC 7502 TaxID=1173263 RepID=UPI00029FFE86|nr:hypothetical protein [Synechococcus sp. PCC 7502]AFY73552.1 hypothetical protein Syn7502_01484 [Synechococcus sp. PCC 7502]